MVLMYGGDMVTWPRGRGVLDTTATIVAEEGVLALFLGAGHRMVWMALRSLSFFFSSFLPGLDSWLSGLCSSFPRHRPTLPVTDSY
jgi:hypothetical protein